MFKKKWSMDDFWLTCKYLFLVFLIAIIVRGFLFIPIQVEGNSMRPTLKQNNWVLVEKISAVKRFDVVVFQLPDGNTYIKRIIGLPGEKLTYKDDQLYINEKKVSESFLNGTYKNTKKNDFFTNNFNLEELLNVDKLGKDSFFVMGDNRRQSKDSRSFGTISSEQIIGKARFVYYPLNQLTYIH